MMHDEELLQVVELEILELLDEYGFPAEKIPIIPGSALEALEETSNEEGGDACITIW